jgi:Sec-independent protein translocase protein TatA
MKNFTKILAITSLMASTVALADGSKSTTTQTATAKTTESATLAGFKKDMADFKNEMSMKLDSAEAEILALKEKAKVKGTKIKQTTINDLESTKAKIKTDLNSLDKSSESAWKSMKTKIANTMDSLNTKTQKALNE